jgi:hypothetical protein
MKTPVLLCLPAEGNAPRGNATVKMKRVPAVGDFLVTYALSPEAGPGASDCRFEVVSRTWDMNGGACLDLKRARDSNGA